MACVGLGWGSNWLLFVFMLLVFVVYGCRLQSINFGGVGLDVALLLSWAWSAAQRFLVHEPLLIILLHILLPLLDLPRKSNTIPRVDPPSRLYRA